MAKPNYSFEKRQREIAKKKKKEEKDKEKASRKQGAPDTEGEDTDADDAEPVAEPQAGAAPPLGGTTLPSRS